jgi:tRNA(fMet)-specific endonuclease VapC
VRYLLDTNICIALIRQRPSPLLARLQTFALDDLALSTITVAELAHGAAKSQRPAQNRQALEHFLMPFAVVPFDQEAALIYGDLRAELERRGTPIGPLDLLIAAQALTLDIPLVTNNRAEVGRVPNLIVEAWLADGAS